MWKHYLVGLGISLAAIYLFLKAAPPGQMLSALSEMDLVYLIPCTVIYLISYVFRSIRWHYLMRPVGRVGFRSLFAALMIGFLGNNLLPAHLGEVVRAYVLGKEENVSKSATFATIVLERVYDGLTVLFLLLLVLLFMDLPEHAEGGSLITGHGLRMAGWLGLLLFAGIMAVLQLLRWQRQRSLKVMAVCMAPLPEGLRGKILGATDSFCDGLAVARARDLGFVALYSLLTWVCLGFWAWSLFPAFHLSLGPMAGILMEVVVALALLIPSAPAFVGTFHLAAAATLGFMGADSGVAGSYAMALWMVHFVTTTTVGIFYLWRLGLGLKAITGASRE